jgi:hypothetical protein
MDHLNAETKYSTDAQIWCILSYTLFSANNLRQENDMLKVYFLNLQTTGLVFNFWRVVYKKKRFIGIEKDKIMK